MLKFHNLLFSLCRDILSTEKWGAKQKMIALLLCSTRVKKLLCHFSTQRDPVKVNSVIMDTCFECDAAKKNREERTGLDMVE